VNRGLFFLATVVLAWGLTWPVNKVILVSLSPIWTVAIRSAVGAAALFALSIALGRLSVPPRDDVPVLLSLALLHMVGFGVLGSVGLSLVPTGRSVVLAYTTPLWVMPGASLFLGERLTARRAIGVIAGLLGLAVLLLAPVVSVVVATLWLREPLTPPLVIALALIIGGVALGTSAPRRVEP
jgi:drug/metabolite transporter (DMT)-like permease